jgi:hypothetical protein
MKINQKYILLISIHGLIRGKELELGRDADTGGQTKYVLELAQSLSKHPEIQQVDLMTKLLIDPQVSLDYSKPIEVLNPKANIIRIACGSNEYIPKEELFQLCMKMNKRMQAMEMTQDIKVQKRAWLSRCISRLSFLPSSICLSRPMNHGPVLAFVL